MSAAKKVKKPESKAVTPVAFQGDTEDGNKSVVGMLNLRVVVIPDGDLWFAQGLDVDYAAAGTSLEDVKARFESGLAGTVHEHLKMYAGIERILTPAPADVWTDLYYSKSGEHFRFSQISFHKDLKDLRYLLPFDGIEYLERVAA